jgi:nitroreductase
VAPEIDVRQHRKLEHAIDPIFINRWSPRAMSGEDLSEEELMAVLEAARWAPSSYNNQSWRFLYARRSTENWDLFFNLLGEGNQIWCRNAGLLVVIISKKTLDHNGKPSRTHSFDTGAAWQNLALQGSIRGLVVHGMQGFDYDKARQVLNVPDEYQVEAMAAVGKPGRIEDLPERLQEREVPSGRKELSEIAFEGGFPRQ